MNDQNRHSKRMTKTNWKKNYTKIIIADSQTIERTNSAKSAQFYKRNEINLLNMKKIAQMHLLFLETKWPRIIRHYHSNDKGKNVDEESELVHFLHVPK